MTIATRSSRPFVPRADLVRPPAVDRAHLARAHLARRASHGLGHAIGAERSRRTSPLNRVRERRALADAREARELARVRLGGQRAERDPVRGRARREAHARERERRAQGAARAHGCDAMTTRARREVTRVRAARRAMATARGPATGATRVRARRAPRRVVVAGARRARTTTAMTSARIAACATRFAPRTARVVRGDGASARERRATTRTRARGREDDGRDPRLISRRDKAANRENAKTWVVVGGAALAMTAAIALVYENSTDGFLYGVDSIESYADWTGGGDGEFDFASASASGGGALDFLSGSAIFGAAVWALGLYYASPVSVVMLFLGRTDSERPSDWLLRKATGTAQMEDANAVSKALIAFWFLLSGVAVSKLGDAAFGDATWQISSGLGFAVIAGVSELGRPKRVDEATMAKLEAQYADFCAFGEKRLSRSGRCHQSEISKAFRAAYPQHAGEDVLDEMELRSLIANYWPGAERSPRGYYKNLSLLDRDGAPLTDRVSVKDLGL